MRAGWLVVVAGVAACTSASGGLDHHGGPPDGGGGPDAAAEPDSGRDTGASDARPCADCEYFPDTCSADVLCPHGLFDPDSPSGGLDPRTSINVIRGRSVSDVWAAGAVGAVAHFDGTSWTRSDTGSQETMRALWLHDSTEVAFGFLDRVYVRGVDVQDGGVQPSAGGWTFHSPSDVSEEDPPTARPEWLWHPAGDSLWRLRRSPSGVFEVQVGVPSSVCRGAGCTRISSIHGSSASELWAVGEAGATVRITDATGGAPKGEAFNSRTRNALRGGWEASPSETWSVGAMGAIRHYAAATRRWDALSDVPTTADLNAVWGASSTDVWAVGNGGVVLHYDGHRWSRAKIAGLGVGRPNLTAVWVAAAGHVWIGGQGVILSLGGKP